MSRTADVGGIEIPALRSVSTGRMAVVIGAVSAAALALLFWLIYFRQASAETPAIVAALPAVNAALNSLAAVFLVAGYVAVRRGLYARHVKLMIAALVSSALFLGSYLVYHYFQGDTKFLGTGVVRPVYFFILISHIVLSVAVLPLVLLSVAMGLAGRFRGHRRVSRYTLPIWLYVSVTGVLVFVFLRLFNPA